MPEMHHTEAVPNASLEEHAAVLAKRGLLTTARAEGKKMEQLQLERPQYGVLDDVDPTNTRVTAAKAARVLRSGIVAAWKFRHKTFERVLLELGRSRKAHTERGVRQSTQQVTQLVSAYWRVRPLLPFDRYTDLIDSLALIEYLSSYRVFPKMVIGVRLMPFTAHTWVQQGTSVFNDSPEFVRQFTPIFSA